ncbi:hypothetical protein B0H34DRAFT_683621 [Crassisporium funariophilum]|nr:hypothetical protein B0H34DRAFT_683621 [Crassisporium funariophilum]
MASFQFIDDLIPLILQAHDHWWPRDYLSLSTVSQSWLFYVRRRLYKHPSINSFSSSTLLARSLSENSSLLPLITGISLRPVVVRSSHCRPQANQLSSLRFLLSLDGLQRVTLGGELAVKAERFLKLLTMPDDIDELHIDGSSLGQRLNSPPSLEWNESMAFQFPKLKELRLTQLELDITPPSEAYPLPITTLILEDVHITNGYLPHLLNGTQSLYRLHITTKDACYADQIKLLLISCTVACLHYEVQNSRAGRFVLDIDSSNAGCLRCLHLKGHLIDLESLRIIHEMCQNLVELVITGRVVQITPQEWRNFIRSGAFSSLQRLGLPWGTSGPAFVAWPPGERREIIDTCGSRNIQTLLS